MNNLSTYICLVFILLMTTQAESQITIAEYDNVDKLMKEYVTTNEQNPTMKAWRIQIITTNDRRKMDRTLAKFRRMYPDIPADWEHKNPYYVVKVGAYKRKIDLQPFLLELKRDFYGSIPVLETLEKSELLGK